MFVIDHLGHIKTDETFANNHLKFTHIINELKDIQKTVKQPIILIAQLNRAVEGKMDKRPSMADIRESGSIEEVADVIIFLIEKRILTKKTRDRGNTRDGTHHCQKSEWSGRNAEAELCEADE